MKLLHTSDWHIGITFRGKSCEEDQQFFLDRICDIIRDRNIDAVLLSGDVFDRGLASSDAIAFYDRAVTRIVADLHTPVLCAAGNHDGGGRLSQCSRLLKEAGLYISGTLTRDIMIAEFEDTEIFIVPWFTAEKARSVFPEKADDIKNLEDAWIAVGDEIRARFTDSKRHIIVTHAFIVNAETSVSDRAAEIGSAAAVGKYVFDGFDYAALGHIHKPQIISDKVRYCGTPMPYSFGKEEKQEKGVVIIDTDDMSQEFVPLELLHKRTTLKGTYNELLAADFPDDVRNGYVRLEVSDSYIGTDAMALFSEKYPLLLEARGRDYDGEGAGITMTLEDFEKKSSDPAEIFKSFCMDTGLDFSEERLSFFKEAVDKYAEEDGK